MSQQFMTCADTMAAVVVAACRTGPSELLMKQLAMIGSTLLVVVLSVRYVRPQILSALPAVVTLSRMLPALTDTSW